MFGRPALPTPQTAPHLGWRVLSGQLPTARGPVPFHYPNTAFVILQDGQGGVVLHVVNTATGARMDRPCSQPERAFVRVLDWARNYGS